MKKLSCTLMLCLAFFCTTKAQNEKNTATRFDRDPNVIRDYPDSIKLEFPLLSSLVVFNLKNVTNDLDYITRFPNQLGVLLEEISQAIADTSLSHLIAVNYSAEAAHTIEITENKNSKTRLSSEGTKITELLPQGWEINISMRSAKIYVYAQTFKQLQLLSKQNFDQAVSKIKTEIATDALHRTNLITRIIVQENKAEMAQVQRSNNSDYLFLGLGGGFGFVNNLFYPELNAHLKLNFNDRIGVNRHQVSINSSFMLFAKQYENNSHKLFLNTFINVAYNYNLSNSNSDPNWIGIGAGLLLKNNESIFNGKTAKFFINSTVGKFNVSPELYLTKDFKNLNAGFKIGYTF